MRRAQVVRQVLGAGSEQAVRPAAGTCSELPAYPSGDALVPVGVVGAPTMRRTTRVFGRRLPTVRPPYSRGGGGEPDCRAAPFVGRERECANSRQRSKQATRCHGARHCHRSEPADRLFDPDDPHFAQVIQGDQKAMDAVSMSDPSIGLYSNTGAAKANVLNQAITDGLTEIVKGTQALTALNQLLSDWRKNGGDQIRGEYEQAFAAANG